MKKVLKWVGIAVLAFILLGVIAVASGDSTDKPTEVANNTPLVYNVVKEEKQSDGMYLRITVDERYDKKDLIEIARKTKASFKWEGKFVAWFYIKQFSESGAWTSISYLPECDDCGTDKDSDGEDVKYLLIGITKPKADSLRALTFDSIPQKKLVASYLEDISACKTEIYEIADQPNRLLKVQIYYPGGYVLDWLNLKVIDGENRYYFEDDDEGNYMYYDTAKKIVHFRNQEGKEWLTFASE